MRGTSGNEGASSLEARIQWITGRVFLNNGERMRVAALFTRAGFKPIPGGFGNFRLEFDGPGAGAAFGASEMTMLRGAILDTAKLVASLKK